MTANISDDIARHKGGGPLPELKETSNYAIMMTNPNPLPTSLQSDFLPDEILLSLTQRAATRQELKPPTKLKSKMGPPANVWNFTGRREKFKHLTENTACICGAGKDISFLYDVPPKKEEELIIKEADPSVLRVKSRQQQKRLKQQDAAVLPDTLIPKEFHMVKSKGVVGLEYHEEKYSTNSLDHEKHLTIFPSMNPVSRYEVLQLKRTMEEMLKKAGVDDENGIEETTLTQMHHLLDLVKKEQDIYNVIFHELIRQTTVECVERGELLANLRKRYSDLLSKIPEQVKDLHNEVVAQRALDRRLTEELIRFKTSVSVLTSELSEIKKHDEALTKEVIATKDELSAALEDSKRNADLLNEYHSLYELQRVRLEKQVELLSDEKELWSSATYCMSMRVTEEYALVTARRLHIAEKTWTQIARHFSLLLTEADTNDLAQLQSTVNDWREKAEIFSLKLTSRETQTVRALEMTEKSMRKFMANFDENYLSEDGHLIQIPTAEEVEEIYGNLLQWEKSVSGEAESFGGDVMLAMQDDLYSMRRLVRNWSDVAVKVFVRHSPTPIVLTSEGTQAEPLPEVVEMNKINTIVEQLMNQLSTRLVGDNGVAQGILTLQGIMESWTTRLRAVVNLQSKPLPESEWSRFYALFDDWLEMIQEVRNLVGTIVTDENPNEIRLDVTDTINELHKWASSTISTIDSEDSRRMEAVSQLHTSMIHWMVQLLLRISPDHPSSTPEMHKASLLSSATPEEIHQTAKILFERIEDFTSLVMKSCSSIVSEITQGKVERREENPDVEAVELKRLEDEANEWVETAKLLLEEMVTGNVRMEPLEFHHEEEQQMISPRETTHEEDLTNHTVADGVATSSSSSINQQNMHRALSQRHIEGVAVDRNTHTRTLQQDQTRPPQDVNVGQDLRTIVETPNAERAYEAIAAIQKLQEQLNEAEKRAETAELESMKAKLKLSEAEDLVKVHSEKIVALERELENLIAEQKDQDPLPKLLFRKPSIEEKSDTIISGGSHPSSSGGAVVAKPSKPISKGSSGQAPKRSGGQAPKRGGH